ncbi:hypothetical protein V2I01_00135 [Micromonospora sp. BRA006-A]|nr:hypothetical protein [Micromonospora sp. BRA006-A]
MPTAAEPAAGSWHATWGRAVPAGPVRVAHRVRVPVAPPPGEPLPVLVAIGVGDHPVEGSAGSRSPSADPHRPTRSPTCRRW